MNRGIGLIGRGSEHELQGAPELELVLEAQRKEGSRFDDLRSRQWKVFIF